MKNLTTETKNQEVRSLSVIAKEIKSIWGKNTYYGAIPYINAMERLNEITDRYGMEDGISIVQYFLSNATTWRGEDARRIKKELNSMLK